MVTTPQEAAIKRRIILHDRVQKSLTILVNGKELVKGTAYTPNAAVSTTVISESFIIPANQHTVVSFKNGGNIGGSITLFVQQV